ncbi:MAG: 3'-5' exonuclease, partial [Anaerolineae bacterium]
MGRVYVALDLETTGVDPERDAIIEIGAVKFRDQQVLDTWSALVNPQRPIPYKIQKLTGIDPQDVQNAPALASVLPRLTSFIGDHPVVGHNVSFEASFLRRHGLLLRNPLVDTFEL